MLFNKIFDNIVKETQDEYIPPPYDNYQFTLGQKIIAKENDNYPPIIGKVVDFVKIGSRERFGGKHGGEIPEYSEEGKDERWICSGVIAPYSDELMRKLGNFKYEPEKQLWFMKGLIDENGKEIKQDEE